jgi:hypothetical protein
MNSKARFQHVLVRLRDLRRIERDKAKRAYLDALINDQQDALEHYSDEIREAKMIGVRNPSFDGDYIGYPDDDFSDDADDEDEKRKKS